jgi:four helix bundle protein
MAAIKSHRELEVYQAALRGALAVSRLVRRLPKHELKLGDQALRSARSPGSSISEAWRKRRYAPQWISKLSDAESESAETQWWLEIFLNEGYCTQAEFDEAFDIFEKLISQLVLMATHTNKWITPAKAK